MKIITIFDPHLYAVQYTKDDTDIFTACIELWTDVMYVRNIVKQQYTDSKKINEIVNEIIEDAENINDTIIKILNDKERSLDEFFMPLNNEELTEPTLAKKKGRIKTGYRKRKSFTRIYGIKIESNCYIISGGALKFHLKMKDAQHTKTEAQNLENLRNYLIQEDIIDKDSFEVFYND